MTPIEKRDIGALPENEKNTYKDDISYKKLGKEINDDLFDKLENGNAIIERNNGTLIFKIKDDFRSSGHRVMINGKEVEGYAFSVKKRTLKRFLQNKLKTSSSTLESRASLNELLTKIEIKNELNKLQNDITGTTIEEQQTNEILKNDTEQLKNKVNDLIIWFQGQKQPRPKAPKHSEDGYSIRRFKHVIKDDLASLASIKRSIESYKYTTSVDYFAGHVETLETHKEQLEKVRQIIDLGGNTSEIPAMLNSLQDIRKEDLFQNTAAKYNLKYNELFKNATMNKLLNKDREAFQAYLQKVWSGEIKHPEQDKFYQKYKKDFKYLEQTDPGLYHKIIQKRKRNTSPNNPYYTDSYNHAYTNQVSRCNDGRSMFEKGGDEIVDMIGIEDPKKKEAWSQFAKIGIIGLGIFAIYKIFTSKGKDRRAWIGGTLGGLLALNNIDGIKKRFKNAFGSTKPSREQIYSQTHMTNNPEMKPLVDGPLDTVDLLGTTSINVLIKKKIVSEKDGHLKIDYTAYKEYINASPMDAKKKKTMLENIKKYKNKDTSVEKGLELMNFNSIDDLKAISGNDDTKTILDGYNILDYFETLSSPINADLEKEGLKAKDAKARKQIAKEHKENPDKNLMPIWIRRGLVKPKISVNNWETMKKSSDLDLVNKEINGLDVKFKTYDELFNVMKLTNFIKKNFKNKTAKSLSPFHVEMFTGNLQFNNETRYKFRKDETDVINSNFINDTLYDLSPALEEKKEKYVKYLNTRWNKSGSVEK